ncbi:anti-sigma B factor antagonist [Photobacterium jeanii]|uniref:Anti-sigma B factor antagonist n=1 Tax=Photobacterium jeanii TaxID=858640 RepID=A0A178KH04_9GAMM|nr:STAS domain-containing protein [Photobacterium jeanii]OAN16547.1 anti-sigma B factor antagonist [Photobacterium jeanii]PST87939.1 STAS domain-containing protein [Photobacterium jeanii]
MATPTTLTEVKWQKRADGDYCLSGRLERDTVSAFWRQRAAWLPTESQVTLDLSAVERVDSAGMVMLLHLCQAVAHSGGHLTLHHVPEQLNTLLRLSHVDSLFAANIT